MDPGLLLLLTLGISPWEQPPDAIPAGTSEEDPAAPVDLESSDPHGRQSLPSELFGGERPVDLGPLPPGLANFSAQACAACHLSVQQSWHGGAHHQSWQDPLLLSAMEASGDAPLCLSCHLPLAQQQPLQLQQYEGGELTRARVQENPSWDPTLQQEGVTCVACHVRDGTVFGVRSSAGPPHSVTVSTELQEPAFCGACHQMAWPGADLPFYDTYGEWSRSAYAEAGVRCQDCHMPPVAGVASTGRFTGQADHGVSLDPARAVSVLVSLPAPKVVRGDILEASVRVQNTGAGHAFPTGSPFTHVVIEATLLDSKGKPVADPLQYLLRRKVTPAPPYTTLEDTRLPPGGEVVLEHKMELSHKAAPGQSHYRVTLAEVRSDGTVEPPFVVQEIPLDLD